MRIALGLEYDGAGFVGWQTQPDGRSVQDALERALAAFAGSPLATVCAGRTDAGVHALAQCVHFDSPVERPLDSWVRGVNRYLPDAVAVVWARSVGPEFHARYGALARAYDYWILNDPVRAPLLRSRVGWVFRPLDVAMMAQAACALVGRHDYTSFRAAQCQAASPVREVSTLAVERHGRLVRVRIEANAFLHHMVRNIVGALVWVGTGRQPASWMGELLAARDRSRGAPTLDAAGLYLTRVRYDPQWDLPAPRTTAPCLQ